MLYTLNLYSVICQLHLNKAGKNKGIWNGHVEIKQQLFTHKKNVCFLEYQNKTKHENQQD